MRIGKAIQELKAEGIPLPTKKQVAEKAKCKPATVNESPAWQRHRLESAPSPAGSPQSVIMPRIKEKTESDGKKTFTVDELKETLEEERERMNKPDNVHVVNQLTKKDIADAMFDGAYRAKARFTEPPDETPIEKIHRLRCDGTEWNYIIRTIFKEEHGKDIDEDLLPAEVKRYQKQHRTAYPHFYER